MPTVDKKIADEVIAGKYPEDRCVKIVKYENNWGGESYGLVMQGQAPNTYAASDFVHNPTLYWEAP
jgi:hypothetical protein